MQLHLIIHGRVQGVFFRAETQRFARNIGIAGWVKNNPDGSVEILAQGEKTQLEQLKSWAHHGPSSATVDRIEEKWLEIDEPLHDFIIIS